MNSTLNITDYLSLGDMMTRSSTMDYGTFQRNLIQASYDLQARSLQIQQQQASAAAVAAAIEARNQALYTQQVKNATISSIKALGEITTQQSDISINTYLTNADELRKSALQDQDKANTVAAQRIGELRVATGASAILLDTGTPLDMQNATLDNTFAQADENYRNKISDSFNMMTKAHSEMLNKKYNQLSMDQQIYFTNVNSGRV